MKKIISVLILMITFMTVFQNIVLGATSLKYANIIKGNTFNTDVQFYEDDIWFTIEANYVYYQGADGEHPAYCISHRKGWGGRSGKLSSRY